MGKKCNECQDGFWNINSGGGCESCACDVTGEENLRVSGQVRVIDFCRIHIDKNDKNCINDDDDDNLCRIHEPDVRHFRRSMSLPLRRHRKNLRQMREFPLRIFRRRMSFLQLQQSGFHVVAVRRGWTVSLQVGVIS